MKSLGLCIGASNIGFVLLEDLNGHINIIEAKSVPHGGNPRNTIKLLINNELLNSIDKFTVTGKKLRTMLNTSSISEPEAIEYAYQFECKKDSNSNIIISAGGENFIVYKLDDKGKIIDVYTGNKCASGTGEFFLQQLKRMNLNIEEAIEKADINNPYKVAGRCSVFCKSDCTHALNKGIPKEKVVAGLCKMMATKILELLKSAKHNKVLIVGGVSKNKVVIDFLKKEIKNIEIPKYATSFEALGAALWGLKNKTKPIKNIDTLFNKKNSSFSFLPPLINYKNKVSFKNIKKEKAHSGDICILGLDVGSTTTKAVLLREKDLAILASCYLRTNGDPIGASRKCYDKIAKEVGNNVIIRGLGVTGSGRQIAGLHALTESIINEITAHARAAVHFDPEVDTIFEIGGQDAKYTYITNGVPCDYAMNEACSAGTGSFLEEAAKESLGIDTLEIADIALKSSLPPNFSDQCAAFISSDIKNAIQEGIETEDIVAGLVYSIAMNYINRVKGNRKVGNKVFMQGGVCYNKAVPLAMASLTGKDIIVPPEPGLMGAFGVALVVKDKLDLGLIKPKNFNLKELANRNVIYKEPFICNGGKEKCDRKCSINRIVINNKIYPFGGACNKYYNLLQNKKEYDTKNLNLVKYREYLVFEKYRKSKAKKLVKSQGKTVGINNSLLVNTLFPLYYNFFTALGYDVITPDTIDNTGIEKKGASFCYPIEISHGAISSLLKKNPDIIFLPHVKSIHIENNIKYSYACPFVQGEPYYLKTAFKKLNEKTVISPVLELSGGYNNVKSIFINIGKKLGFNTQLSEKAFEIAVNEQLNFEKECQEIGEKFLKKLEQSNEIGIVLFGRPYNAFAKLANMGIPHKFASRGYKIIPHDFLPFGKIAPVENMYWAMGQMILKAAKIVKNHPNLFGVYITNFSCGPDSFVVGYFRNIMEDKPSLTLELDSHTADAGIDTRIEAFLDVVKSYMEINTKKLVAASSTFIPAKTIIDNNKLKITDSNGIKYDLKDKRVHVLIPSMGNIGSQLLAASFRYMGVNASSVPAPNEKELKLAQGLVSCKECLPLMLTVGSLINYIKTRKNDNELLVYFMPEASGPCRFGQYNILMQNIVEKMQLKDVAILSLSSENSYAGLGIKFVLRTWQSIIIADILEEIYSSILVLSKNKDDGLKIYREVCNEIIQNISTLSWKKLKESLKKSVKKLNSIKTKCSINSATKVALIGEIYVRRDDFSRQFLVERLAEKNIIVKTAPVSEWIYYIDYLMQNKLLLGSTFDLRLKSYIQGFFKNYYEKTIKEIFSSCKFYENHTINIDRIIESVSDIISPNLTGEAILTIGTAILQVIEEVAGVISIGPFGCMPSRISEAIIKEKINEKKLDVSRKKELVSKVMQYYPNLPFLSIETDGNPFPQIVESKLETFCLQVQRIQNKILEITN
ncbi:acyl-CoA dehydratase activase [Caminicella sporogenes]|uniref:acyl-CoA dehydratase activase n=1 Tax=Caminicella sporogenes TaxID=166485 RepID=UPI00253F7FFB|nr:acyl-CoA dehydratase activase [Caminicella sporogenes]WIF95969.1 acyl-CoA dehydratase activase [Caminicella sporogenes]